MIRFDLHNRVAVVTGGAQGFGLAIVNRFIESGATVIIWDIDEKAAKEAVDKIKSENLSYSIVDVSNFENVAKNLLNIEKKFGKRKVDLIECRMHKYPEIADWSMYRENESSFFENVLTQQIIFMFNKKEYVITVACIEKCEQTKNDLFQLVKTIKF